MGYYGDGGFRDVLWAFSDVLHSNNHLGHKEHVEREPKQGVDCGISFFKKLVNRMQRKQGELNEEDKQFAKSMAFGEAQKSSDEIQNMRELGINYHMLHDDGLEAILGTMINAMLQQGVLDYDLMALRVTLSPLMRVTFIDDLEAEILKIRVKRELRRIEMSMPEDVFEEGGVNFLESIQTIAEANINCARDGRLTKWLKVSPKQFEITMGPIEKQKRSA